MVFKITNFGFFFADFGLFGLILPILVGRLGLADSTDWQNCEIFYIYSPISSEEVKIRTTVLEES
jgi:hypothetical protein